MNQNKRIEALEKRVTELKEKAAAATTTNSKISLQADKIHLNGSEINV